MALTPLIFIGSMALLTILLPQGGWGRYGGLIFLGFTILILLSIGVWLFVILREPEIDISEMREMEEKDRLKKEKKTAKRKEKVDHSLDKTCPKCGAKNPKDSTFCQSCSTPIGKLRNQ